MALQAKDLMLGNLLTFEGCLKEGNLILIKIVELHEYDNEFLASIDGDPACDTLELDEGIVGIPFTEEILEKNGLFPLCKGVWASKDGGLMVTKYDEGIYTVEVYNKGNSIVGMGKCQYVHEFQNILTINHYFLDLVV